MDEEKERLLFECLSVLLSQESITINPGYQNELIDKYDKYAMLEDKE